MKELIETIESGRAILFTGAGFSSGARDTAGEPLPDAQQMRAELWALCFGDEACDRSTLSDLYDVALIRAPAALQAYVARRLTVGDTPLPAHLARWFAAPWQRVYTLNVDDLEVALARQYQLPAHDVVHLNGLASDGAHALTFSTLQYAARVCGTDPVYARLAEDLARAPFVFVGTTLDEIVLWQHVQLRDRDRPQRARQSSDPPRSYLVTASLSRARHVLLESLGIVWIRATIEDVARHLPAPACALHVPSSTQGGIQMANQNQNQNNPGQKQGQRGGQNEGQNETQEQQRTPQRQGGQQGGQGGQQGGVGKQHQGGQMDRDLDDNAKRGID